MWLLPAPLIDEETVEGVIFIHAQESCPLNLFSAVAVQAAVWRSVVRIYSNAAVRLLPEGLGFESRLWSLHVLPVRMWVFSEHSSFLPKVQKHTCQVNGSVPPPPPLAP